MASSGPRDNNVAGKGQVSSLPQQCPVSSNYSMSDTDSDSDQELSKFRIRDAENKHKEEATEPEPYEDYKHYPVGQLPNVDVDVDEGPIENIRQRYDAQDSSLWDPEHPSGWTSPTHQCLLRIKRDVMTMFKDPPPMMFVVPERENITRIHAVIVGPHDTPYEGGFFHFLLRMPHNYPEVSPRVKFLTTSNGTVQFNPNLYKNGKVCLSILGTWTGPRWNSKISLTALLISIQSLLSEKPYHNEPGYQKTEAAPGDAKRYSDAITHDTISYALCEMLESGMQQKDCPEELRTKVEEYFLENFRFMEMHIKRNYYLTGKEIEDPFKQQRRGKFDFHGLLTRLENIHEKIAKKYQHKMETINLQQLEGQEANKLIDE